MVDLITEHIDIWTSAQTPKTNGGRGRGKSSNGQTLHGIKKLRELILGLAVRGKLIPQDPNDEPARVLLEKIAAEKAKLIKEGKIKKQKKLPEISEDEKQFGLPKTWEWARLAGLYYSISPSGKKLKTSEIMEEGDFPVVDQGKTYVAGYTNEQNLLIEIPGPVIVFGDHTTEKKYVDFNFVAGADGTKILRPYNMDEKYFYTYLLSYKLESRGYARHFKVLNDNLMAVPPLAEQHRIVAKVDELMALCDKLEQQQTDSNETHQTLVETLLKTLTSVADQTEFVEAWQLIEENFDILFTTEESIDQLKQTILQLAVMGKLVPQDPNDKPASTILEKFAKEKARLVKEGKIKKQKPLPKITEDEKPFDLPPTWEWVRLGSFWPDFQNGASSRGDKEGREVVVLRLADISNWRVSLEDTRSLIINEKSIDKYLLEENDILIIRVNGSADIVGRFILCDREIDAVYCDHFIRMRFTIEALAPAYLELLASSKLIRDSISELFVSTAGQKTVNQKHISSLLVTLPPLSEQHRIVAKVDELMALCDTLKERLHDAQTTQIQLADVIVEKAVA